MWNFEVYCGKSGNPHDDDGSYSGLENDLETTDKFFTFVPLFLDLLEKGTMATSTLRANRKYTPKAMFAKKITKKQDIRWIDYKMYEEGRICCAVWKDKQAVVLLSTYAEPVALEGDWLYEWRKFKEKKKKVRMGPMHL